MKIISYFNRAWNSPANRLNEVSLLPEDGKGPPPLKPPVIYGRELFYSRPHCDKERRAWCIHIEVVAAGT
jgi:hypothetical protein